MFQSAAGCIACQGASFQILFSLAYMFALFCDFAAGDLGLASRPLLDLLIDYNPFLCFELLHLPNFGYKKRQKGIRTLGRIMIDWRSRHFIPLLMSGRNALRDIWTRTSVLFLQLFTMVARVKIPPLALSSSGVGHMGAADFGHGFERKI